MRPGGLVRLLSIVLLIGLLSVFFVACQTERKAKMTEYKELLTLFKEWREFERPPMLEGAPDYTAVTFASRHEDYLRLRRRLEAMETKSWSVPEKVDWQLVRAEMNGFDFNHRILKPWVRDPAFYQSIKMERSDVPAHEGPTHHAVTEFWTYKFPLTPAEEQRLLADLRVIPALMRQARRNLTGNARELWIAGIRNIRSQRADLDEIAGQAGQAGQAGSNTEILAVIAECRTATDELIAWLEAEAPKKDGPSGIGKENYTWYQRNVHLLPMTWDEEVGLLKRELDRAWSSLKLEEHRNRRLPPLVAAATPAEYDEKADKAATRLMKFLREQEILTVTDYMEPALREHLGEFVPAEKRNFFQIGAHYDPLPLFTHFYHWFELARMEREPHPSPVRQGALLYNDDGGGRWHPLGDDSARMDEDGEEAAALRTAPLPATTRVWNELHYRKVPARACAGRFRERIRGASRTV